MGVGKIILIALLTIAMLASLGYALVIFGGPLSDGGWDLDRWMRNDGYLGVGMAIIFLLGILTARGKKKAEGADE